MADPNLPNLDNFNDQVALLRDQITSLSDKLKQDILAQMSGLGDQAQRVANIFQKDISKSLDKINGSLGKQTELVEKIKRGENVAKDIAKEQVKLDTERQKLLQTVQTLKLQGVDVDEEAIELALENIELQQQQLDLIEEQNIEEQKKLSLYQKFSGALGGILDQYDKTGTLSKLLSGNLKDSLTFGQMLQVAAAALVKAMFDVSAQTASIRKELGLSSEASYRLRNDFAAISSSSENSFINVDRLVKGFNDLSKETGLVADFGGQTLESFTSLNQQMGFSTKEAAQLVILSRSQGKNTEQILAKTVSTVSSMNKFNKIGINVKSVLEDIANASAAMALSLGKSPEALAKAAYAARQLGTNLQGVESIASGLVDFERTITAQIEAQVLTGRQLNLEAAQYYALINDTENLAKELSNQLGTSAEFSKMNRLQQDAMADAINVSREELAQMLLEQDKINMSAEQFKATYGEATYEQLQSQSAAEELANTMAKLQEIVANLGTLFAPILDAITAITSNAIALYGIMGGLIGRAIYLKRAEIGAAVAKIFSSSFSLGPLAGAVVAGAGIAALFAAVNQAQQVKDGIAPSGNGPFTITDSYGATAVTAKGDGVVVSPNISKGGGGMSDAKMDRMIALLEKLANKSTTLQMDGRVLAKTIETSPVSSKV
jgi:hypothetical protein